MRLISQKLNYLIALVPTIYFLLINSKLPGQVVIHYNIEGVADNYGSKYVYLILCLIPLLIAILNTCFRKYTNKQNEKYFSTTMTVIIIFFSIIACYFIAILYQNTSFSGNVIVVLLSLLFLYFGIIFKKIKQNKYFGIRFLATLKNEKIWNKIHLIGGYLFTILGALLLIFTIIGVKAQVNIIIMIICLLTIIIGLWIYSIYLMKKDVN